jgi:flagellar biosynthesis/type III secretory pathway M-ring protein FliF/YscJ
MNQPGDNANLATTRRKKQMQTQIRPVISTAPRSLWTWLAMFLLAAVLAVGLSACSSEPETTDLEELREQAAEQAEQRAEEARSAVEDAAEDVQDMATDAYDEAAEAAEDAYDEAAEAAEDAAEEAEEALENGY